MVFKVQTNKQNDKGRFEWTYQVQQKMYKSYERKNAKLWLNNFLEVLKNT